MVCVIAVGIGFIVTFSYSERIITWLARPVKPVKLAFLEPTEPFWVNMKVALVAGAFLVLPVLLYQVWAFVAPGPLPARAEVRPAVRHPLDPHASPSARRSR